MHIGLQDAIITAEDARTKLLDTLVDIDRSGKRGHFAWVEGQDQEAVGILVLVVRVL